MEERFDGVVRTQLGARRRPNEVILRDDGMAVGSSFLKQPVVIPYGQIAWVHRNRVVEEDDRVWARPLKALALPAGGGDSNVAVGFRPAVRFFGFTFGAENILTITKKERRRGAEVELLQVCVADPDGLTSALLRRGVSNASSLADGAIDLAGEATGEEARDIKSKAARAGRRTSIQLGLYFLAFLLLGAARAAGPDLTAERFVRMLVPALCLAGVVAVAVMMLPVAERSGPPAVIQDQPRRNWAPLLVLAVMVALAGGGVLLQRNGLLARPYAFAPLLGGLPGASAGWLLRGLWRGRHVD